MIHTHYRVKAIRKNQRISDVVVVGFGGKELILPFTSEEEAVQVHRDLELAMRFVGHSKMNHVEENKHTNYTKKIELSSIDKTVTIQPSLITYLYLDKASMLYNYVTVGDKGRNHNS